MAYLTLFIRGSTGLDDAARAIFRFEEAGHRRRRAGHAAYAGSDYHAIELAPAPKGILPSLITHTMRRL